MSFPYSCNSLASMGQAMTPVMYQRQHQLNAQQRQQLLAAQGKFGPQAQANVLQQQVQKTQTQLRQQTQALQQVQMSLYNNYTSWGTATSTTPFLAYPSTISIMPGTTFTLTTSGNTGTAAVVPITIEDCFIPAHNELPEKLDINDGKLHDLTLPDGTRILIDKDGNFTIDDKKSKIVYKSSNVRSNNRFMDGSDLLEEFLESLHNNGLDITKDQVLSIGVKHYIQWIVIKAAEKDGDNDLLSKEVNIANLVKDLKNSFEQSCLNCDTLLPTKVVGVSKYCCGACMDEHLSKPSLMLIDRPETKLRLVHQVRRKVEIEKIAS